MSAGSSPDLRTDSSAVVAIHRSRVILLLYVEDKQAFEKILTEKAKAAFGIEAPTKAEKIGEHQMKVLSDDPARQIAWTYAGKLALVTMPATTTAGALEEGSATLVLAEIADQKKETSIWAEKSFQAFRKALVDSHPIAVYLNTTSSLETEAVKKEIEGDPNAQAVTDWVKKNVTFVGAGITADGDKAKARVHLGVTDEIRKKMIEAKTVKGEANWSAFATENLLLGARVSLDVQKSYALLLEMLPEENKRALRRDMKRVGDGLSLDMEADVIGKLDGQIGVFFYGIAGNPLSLMSAKSMQDIARAIGLMFVVRFDSPESVDTLVQKVVATAGGAVSVRPFTNLPDDPSFKVLEVTTPGSTGKFFLHGNTVVYATHAFGDEAMHKYLTAARDEKKLSEVAALDLGKEYATEKGFTGLYFNSKRAQENLGSALAFGGVGEILAALEEVQLAFEVDEVGVEALLTVDLVPAKAPAAQKPAKAAPIPAKPKK